MCAPIRVSCLPVLPSIRLFVSLLFPVRPEPFRTTRASSCQENPIRLHFSLSPFPQKRFPQHHPPASFSSCVCSLCRWERALPLTAFFLDSLTWQKGFLTRISKEEEEMEEETRGRGDAVLSLILAHLLPSCSKKEGG